MSISPETSSSKCLEDCARRTIKDSMLALVGIYLLHFIIAVENLMPDAAPIQHEENAIFTLCIGIIIFFGSLGGCLYNFRGLIKHTKANTFDSAYEYSYRWRPLAGAICGLISFFLLIGGVFTFTGATSSTPSIESLGTVMGRMPYVAVAILAGYSSDEFMAKLKDVASVLFKVSDESKRTDDK